MGRGPEDPILLALVLLGICALVLVVLLLPFQRPPPGSAPAREGPGSPPREIARGAGSASARPERPHPDETWPSAGEEPEVVETARAELLQEKDRLFQALADLRFDHEAGKLSREDFEAEDALLRARAAAVLRDLESLDRSG